MVFSGFRCTIVADWYELITAGLAETLNSALVARIAAAANKSEPDLLNELAFRVAEDYLSGRLSFEDGNIVMNAVFSCVVSEDSWAKCDAVVPPALYEVYLAFDAGEYIHPGDASGSSPEVLYTRPLIEKFLATRRNFL